jgi:Stress responsive A/B Barrel Domain
MIRHVVLFRWAEETTEEQKQRVAAELARLPALVPSLRAFHIGSDLGINQGNFDFAVAADFDDVDGYLAYRDHPEHRAMISQFILPAAAQRVAVQYEFLGGTGCPGETFPAARRASPVVHVSSMSRSRYR